MRKAAKYDVVILGSGSTAAAAAKEARELDKKVLLTEERLVGGTCLNYGCIPSKFLIEAAKSYFTMKRPRFYGVQCEKSSLAFEELIQQKDEIIRNYREKKRDTISDDSGITLVRGHASFVDSNTIDVEGKRFSGEKIVIATGSRPMIPKIEGLSPSGFVTSDILTCDEPEELTTLPKSLVIIGGGYIAVELGQTFARFGTEVTIIERGPQILKNGYEPEVGEIIQRALEEEGINILFNASVHAVSKSKKTGYTLQVKQGHKQFELNSTHLLIATGRQPNADNINAENAGVNISKKGYVKVNKYFRTNIENIFAAGDVIGPEHGNQLATPVGVRDAKLAVRNAFCEVGGKPAEHKVIPRTIFSDPEVGSVGLTLAQAKKKGFNAESRSLPLSYVPRAVLMQHTDGLIKFISDADTEEILGATIVSPFAGELVQQVAFGMKMNARLSDFIELLYVYPSLSEGLKFAARREPDEKFEVDE